MVNTIQHNEGFIIVLEGIFCVQMKEMRKGTYIIHDCWAVSSNSAAQAALWDKAQQIQAQEIFNEIQEGL